MNSVEPTPNSKEALDELQREVEGIIAPLGYELVALDHSGANGARKITLFIDFLDQRPERISLDDCVAVNDAVDACFESTKLISGHFTLDVSSPGIERPLAKTSDYQRFAGESVKIHTIRSLDHLEIGNDSYWQLHQKQKNFSGKLQGLSEDGQNVKLTTDGQNITVPLSLITKAHLGEKK